MKGGTWRGAGLQAIRVLVTHFASAYPQRGSRPQLQAAALADPRTPEGALWRSLAAAAASLPSQLRKAGGSFFAPAGEGLGAAADELVAIVAAVAQVEAAKAYEIVAEILPQERDAAALSGGALSDSVATGLRALAAVETAVGPPHGAQAHPAPHHHATGSTLGSGLQPPPPAPKPPQEYTVRQARARALPSHPSPPPLPRPGKASILPKQTQPRCTTTLHNSSTPTAQVADLLERFKRDSALLQPQLRAVVRSVSAMAAAAALAGAGAGGGRPRDPPADPTTSAALAALFRCVPLALPEDVRAPRGNVPLEPLLSHTLLEQQGDVAAVVCSHRVNKHLTLSPLSPVSAVARPAAGGGPPPVHAPPGQGGPGGGGGGREARGSLAPGTAGGACVAGVQRGAADLGRPGRGFAGGGGGVRAAGEGPRVRLARGRGRGPRRPLPRRVPA